jgi:hypothetical protein
LYYLSIEASKYLIVKMWIERIYNYFFWFREMKNSNLKIIIKMDRIYFNNRTRKQVVL